MELNIDAKFEGKMTCAFKNDEEFSTFGLQHVWKSKNWDFGGVVQSKVENV